MRRKGCLARAGLVLGVLVLLAAPALAQNSHAERGHLGGP